MKEYREFHARDEDVMTLLSDQRMTRLVSVDADGWPRVGLHVFVSSGLDVELHLVNDDPQLEDIRRDPRVVVEVDDILASSPSYWVDDQNASHADQFYRCASIRGTAELIAEPPAVTAHLRSLLSRHQPEKRYTEVDESHPLYAGYIGRLTLVRVQARSVVTKFKLGQRTTPDVRNRVVAGLRARGSTLDERTAALIEATGRL